MEVILSDGWGVQLTSKGMRRYLEKSKLDGFLYVWPDDDDEEEMCTRMDEGDDHEFGEPNWYLVVAGDLGKRVPVRKASDNILIDWHNFSRTDQMLIEVLKELKREADANGCLTIATIPDGIEWHIESDSEYGTEWVVEGPTPRVWYGKPL
jgi:hypothetical protein